MKTSSQVESYLVKKYPNGMYQLLFNTKDRYIHFHQFCNTQYRIGGKRFNTEDEFEDYLHQIPEGLIPEDVSFMCTTLQEKDQISFYFIPRELLHRTGEVTIFDSKNPF